MKEGKLRIEYAVFQFLWLIVMLPKPVQLLALYAILFVMLHRSGWRCLKNPVSLGMLILMGVHLFAIAFNLLVLDTDEGRFTAAMNTLLLWPLGAGYYACYLYVKPDLEQIGRYCCFNLLVLFLEAVAAAVLYRLTGLDEIWIGDKALYSWVQFNDVKTTRFIGFNDFSNMNMIYAMLMFMLSLAYLRYQRLTWRLVATAMFLFVIWQIRSRSGLLLAGGSLVMCVVEWIPRRYRKLTVCLAVVGGLAVGVLLFGKLLDILLNRIIFRNASSNGLRLLIWRTSLEEVWNLSPLWGMGIKRIFITGYPLGSHSTYLGFFYKTGILGTAVGLFTILRANWSVFRNLKRSPYLRMVSLFLLSFVILLVLEDIDGSNWFMVLYFSTLALLSRRPESVMQASFLPAVKPVPSPG